MGGLGSAVLVVVLVAGSLLLGTVLGVLLGLVSSYGARSALRRRRKEIATLLPSDVHISGVVPASTPAVTYRSMWPSALLSFLPGPLALLFPWARDRQRQNRLIVFSADGRMWVLSASRRNRTMPAEVLASGAVANDWVPGRRGLHPSATVLAEEMSIPHFGFRDQMPHRN